MAETRRNILVGLFVLVGIAAAGTLAGLFGQGLGWWSSGQYLIRIHFDSASGVKEDTLVQIGGLRVGSVNKVYFVNKADFTQGVNVDVVFEPDIQLPAGSFASTSEPGLGMGRPPIEITPGPPNAPRLASGAEIPGNVRKVMESLIPPTITATFEKTAAQLGDAADALKPVLEDMHELMQPRSPMAVDAPVGPQGNLSTAMARLDSALRHFNTILGDAETQSSLKLSVANLQTITEDGKQMTSDLKLAAADARQLIADAKTLPQEIGGKLKGTLENVDTRVDDLSRALTGSLNLASEFLTEANTFAQRTNRGEGTIGRLATDDRLYEAMTLTFRRLAETLDEFKTVAKQWQEGKIRGGVLIQTDALTLTNVTKRYGPFTAVDGLSLHVPQGEIVGFLGPNGAGKTTTIRMIMSINYPDAGEIRVLGAPRAIDVKDRIGYLPEERGLYRKMTVEQTLRYFGRLKGAGGASLGQRITDGLERVGLADWRRKRVEALSKGMQQKVQFLATLLHEPELVILDEPFSGLDPLNRDLLETLLLDLKRAGRTVLFSTHQMEQAERLCDRIVLINRGRRLIEGTVHDVRARFASRVVSLSGEGDFASLRSQPGVQWSHVTAGAAEFELADGADPAELLRRATQSIRLSHFEIKRPSLQEIFVKLVGEDRQAAGGNRGDRV